MSCFAQVTGFIRDSKMREGIPFASVGIKGTSKGTLTDDKGRFELQASEFTDKDTIKISSIGYVSLNLGGDEFKKLAAKGIYLEAMTYNLAEVVVKPDMIVRKKLGTYKYSTGICTAFSGQTGNWRGEQAAILIPNKEKKTYYFESFGFYVVKNEYEDSLQFRVMFYNVDSSGFPGETFLKKPILFKTKVKNGEVRIDLRDRQISTDKDFFVSLECLEEKMESTKFCFAGSVKVPSYFKPSAFAKWGRVRGGGGDLNVEVSYQK
jgi:hypothetical protein